MTTTSTRVSTAILKALHMLLKRLIKRIQFHNDPRSYSVKTIGSQIDSRLSSACSISNGNNEDSANSKSISLENNEDVVLLQAKQLSLPHFGVRCLGAALDFFTKNKRLLGKCNTKIQKAVINTLYLLESAVHLLSLTLMKTCWNFRNETIVIPILSEMNENLVNLGEILEFYR